MALGIYSADKSPFEESSVVFYVDGETPKIDTVVIKAIGSSSSLVGPLCPVVDGKRSSIKALT
jgi:hypothetical protein